MNYFASDAASIQGFKSILRAAPGLRRMLTPELERWALPWVQRLGCVPGLSPGESTLFRGLQLRTAPPEECEKVFAYMETFEPGCSVDLRESVGEIDQTLRADGRAMLERTLDEYGIDPVGLATEAGLVQPEPAPAPAVEPIKETDNWRAAIEEGLKYAAAEAKKKQGKPPPVEQDAAETHRGALERQLDEAEIAPPRPKARSLKPSYATNERRLGFEQSWDTLHGENEADADPRTRAEFMRDTAKSLREKHGHDGDDWRHHLSRAYDRVHSDDPAQYEERVQADLEEATRLDGMASEEERMSE
jgi:hypothetical protein